LNRWRKPKNNNNNNKTPERANFYLFIYFFFSEIKKRNARNMGGPAGTYRAHMFQVEGELLLAALLV